MAAGIEGAGAGIDDDEAFAAGTDAGTDAAIAGGAGTGTGAGWAVGRHLRVSSLAPFSKPEVNVCMNANSIFTTYSTYWLK